MLSGEMVGSGVQMTKKHNWLCKITFFKKRCESCFIQQHKNGIHYLRCTECNKYLVGNIFSENFSWDPPFTCFICKAHKEDTDEQG